MWRGQPADPCRPQTRSWLQPRRGCRRPEENGLEAVHLYVICTIFNEQSCRFLFVPFYWFFFCLMISTQTKTSVTFPSEPLVLLTTFKGYILSVQSFGSVIFLMCTDLPPEQCWQVTTGQEVGQSCRSRLGVYPAQHHTQIMLDFGLLSCDLRYTGVTCPETGGAQSKKLFVFGLRLARKSKGVKDILASPFKYKQSLDISCTESWPKKSMSKMQSCLFLFSVLISGSLWLRCLFCPLGSAPILSSLMSLTSCSLFLRLSPVYYHHLFLLCACVFDC